MKQWFIFGILILFSLISTITLSSIASDLAPTQFSYFLLAGAVYVLVSKLHFSQMLKVSTILYGILLISLILPFFLEPIRNTYRWFSIFGVITVQPSQLAVPFTAIFISSLLPSFKLSAIKDVCIIFSSILAPAMLILLEPDLGTTLIFLATMSSVIFIAGIQWKYIAATVGVGLIGTIFAWSTILQPYQKARITSFLEPTAETSNSYNVNQAIIAVGSGGVFGKGLGQGSQSKLRFLPERETDFIFASFAEEFGFIGSMILIALYTALTGFIAHFIPKVSQEAAYYLTAVFSLLVLQISIHILMNMGLLPVTGVTLPFISYGGSSILSFTLLLAGAHSAITSSSLKENTLHIS